MAFATTISAVTCTLTGATATAPSVSYATAETIGIYGPSGGELDFNTLQVEVTSATQATCINYLVASDEFSGSDLGNLAFTVTSVATVYIGGKGFDAARFKQTGTSGTAYCEILIACSSDFAIRPVQGPYPITG